MLKVIYKPTFTQLENGKFRMSCIIFDERGQKIETITPNLLFDSQEQADRSMKEYCERKGYLIN